MRSRMLRASDSEANPALVRNAMPWIFVSTLEVLSYKSIAFLWKSLSLLSRNAVVVLVIYFIWKLLGGFPMLASACSWLRRNCRRPSFCPEIPPKLLSLSKWFFQKVADWEKKIVEGIKRKVFGRLPDGVAQRAPGSSVRQLLCDDVACKVCERAAQEASQLMSGGRAGGYSFPSFRASLSHGPCVGRRLQLDTPDSFPQSASAPDPISRGAPLPPTRSASCGGPLRPPSFPAEDGEQTFSVAERVSEGSRGSSRRSGDLVEQEEEVLLVSSTTHETSQMSWTESVSSLSELSFSSLEGGTSCRCGRVPRKLRQRRRDSSWVKSSRGSQTSVRDTESFFLRMRMYSQSSPSEASHGRGRKTMAPREGRREAPRSVTDPSSSRAQAFTFTAADISFLDKAVVASLESHLLGKKVQHLLGLPPALLRSLRGFVPSAPRPAPRRGPVGATVVTVPQALSFVAESARKRLELHLKKMVQMKHWQMPQKVQEALRHMKPPSQPRETAAFPPKKRTPDSSNKLAKESCSVLSCAWKQQELQRNLAKRALEMQLGGAAPKIQQFRKASPPAPKPALPKVILPGLRPPEPRSQQIHFLDLQVLSHIQLNITHKKLTYRLGLPTLYHRSLAQLLPDAVFPTPTSSLPRRSAAFGFAPTQIRFLCPKAREELEWHVKRKALQHAWGLPGLIQRSLRMLLSTCHQVRPRNARAGKVSISTPELPFLSRAIQRELEKNVQKRIIHQRWMLPQRVLDSMRLLYPQGQLGKRTGPMPCAVGQQRRQKAQRMVAPAPPLLLPTQLAKTQVVLRSHLAKKSLEVSLEVFPAAVRVSWRYMLLVLRRPLPKVIHPGHRPLLPRRPLPLLAIAEQVSRIEVAVKCSHLASLWGLGTRYTEALRAMRAPGPPRWRRTAFTFSGVQLTILPRAEAEALERHIGRKRLQHEWGIPLLVQRSLRYLVCEPPPLLPLRQAGVPARVLVQDLLLPQSFRNRLELHVQKMKLQRLWGLPRRVAESLRMLRPELKPAAHRQKSPAELVAKSTPRKDGPESRPVSPAVGTLCIDCRQRKAGAVSRGFPGVGYQNLEKIRVHSAKKSMEVHWEIFPAVAVSSWRRAVFMSRQPLPKRVLRGEKPLQPRKLVLTFVLAEDAKRIEVSVQRYLLSSLWGLGQKYVEALSAMAPAPHPQLPRYRRASLGFSQVQALFLPQEDRESLERHVRKKKLQHEWGFPASIQSSLRAFMQGPPLPGQVPLPGASSRTKIWVQTLHGEFLFLPRSTRMRLEHHIQRLKLQRQWGLPRRILKSMQLLFPGKNMLPEGSSLREPSSGAGAKPWTVGAKGFEPVREKGRRMVGASVAHSAKLCVPLEGMSLEKLQLHVTKKSLEVHLGAFPAVPRRSRQRASLSLSQNLPRLIHPGSATLRPRSSCLLFSADQMGQIEMAVQHNYLVSLWGLGTRYVEAVAAMAPRPPFRTPARRRGAAFEFLAVETLFFQAVSREELELHIRKKRIQHMWEFPALVQRSLWGFMQGPPRLPGLPKTSVQICVLHQELLFLPRGVCRLLEFHIQRRKLQRRWGLPRKVLASLQPFLPTAPPGRALLPQSGKEKKLTKAEFSTAGSRAADARRRKTCNVPPVKMQCMESSTRATLETHLKKKALESKFQLMVGYKAPAGPIRRAPLPKPPSLPSGVRPRRPLLLFVEQEALLKIQLNIKQKHLTCLWGLPSLQIKSLSKMYGEVPGRPLAGKVATAGSRRETPKGPVATGLKPWRWGAPFLTQEASDLLEMHILRKKLQHKWGLPATIQKSLSAFPRSPSKLQRSPTRAVEVRIVTTQRLVFLDPVTAGRLEAHVKSRTAAHRWGLPKVVQESLKGFLPPGSAPQADQARTPLRICSEGLQAPLGTRDQGLPAVASPSQADQTQTPLCTCSKDLQMPLGPDGQGLQAGGGEAQSPLEKQVESERQLLPRAGGQSSELSPGEMQLETSQHGREAPKTELDRLPAVTTCLTDEARESLEFHVRRKRVQHGWSLPSSVQRSQRAFAPPPPEAQGPAKARAVVLVTPEKSGGQGKGGAAAHPPQSMMEVMIPRRILRFLCPNVKDCLETHVKGWATEHRWGLPRMFRRSVRSAPPAQEKSSAGEKKHSHSEAEESTGTLHAGESKRPVRFSKRGHGSPQQQEIHPHSEGEESLRLVHAGERRSPVRFSKHHHDSRQLQETHSHSEGDESLALQSPKKASLHKPKGHQRKQRPARNVGTAAEISPTLKPRFLTDEALQLLEFHIIHKRIQHAWAAPSVLQKSLDALAPFALRQGKGAPKTHRWGGAEVRTIANDLSFLKPDTKERLEAHIRTLTARHRWEIPKRVQQSLKTFMGFRPPSRSEVGLFPCQCRSWQAAAGGYQTSDDDNKGSPQGTEGRRKATKKRKVLSQGQRGTRGGHEANVFLFPGVRLPFLQHEAQNVLEFHIQRKKLQHAWGLPSAVLRSLQAFAPLPLESHKKRPPRKIVAHQIPWEEGDVQTVTRSLSFLSPERKEHLNAHLRRMIGKRRWGLPERVQQSLRAFRPSRPASQPELGQSRQPSPPPSNSPQDAADSETEGGSQWASGTEGDNEDDSGREATGKLRHRREAAAAAARANVSTFFSPEGLSPFLPHEAQNALEFHIRHKRLQHSWGLPSAVLKSLQAFAPLPLEPHEKRPPRKSAAHPFPWEEEKVGIMTRGLVFINSEAKERLEAHVRSLTAGHRWGLQKHAQEAMRAFQLPRPPSVVEMGLETQPYGYQEAFRISSPFELEVEKLSAAAPSATSISCERELPFLAGHLQDFLEFHIQRKKVQHDWGLPATIQRSLRAFAPVPRGLQESPLPGTGTSIAAARAKGVAAGTRAGAKKGPVGKEVQVGARQLHFLHVGTKEHLEKHIRGLKAEHRWHVPKVVQESARAFNLRAHGPQEEEEEEEVQLSTYDQTLDTSDTPFKTETELESSSSWEDIRTYHAELFFEPGEASWVETEEPSLCLCVRMWPQEARGGWEAGREAPRRSPLQEEPLQGSWLKKPRQAQRSRIPGRMQEPGVSPLPQTPRRPPKYVHNAGRRPERKPSSQRVRYTCGRITHPAARSSNTSLGKRKKKKTARVPWQPEGSFEEMTDDSHLPPGQLALLPKGSEAGWEHRKGCELPSCSSPSHFSREATAAATSSSSQLAAEQKWQQQEEEEGAENGQEAEGGSCSLLSEDIEQVPGPSSGESTRDASLPEQEATEANLRPLQGTEQQSRLFASQRAFREQAYAVEPQSSYEDVVARNYRTAGSIRQVKSRSGLRTGGRKVGWGREKTMDLPSQTTGDADWSTDTGRQASSATRELGRWSSESLCQECLSLKSASWKEGSEEDSAGTLLHQGARRMGEGTEASSDSPKDSEWQVLPASPNEGFQRDPSPGLPLQMDDEEALEGREEQATSSGSEEQQPVSMGSMSQFSTECEWEQVGDWDSKEEGFVRIDWQVKEEEEEEGGGGSSGSNWPGAGREAMGSRRHENSPTDSRSVASLKKARPSQTALLWEARFALSHMATESASEHLSAPQQAIAGEVTEGMMPLGRPPSPATSLGSGEQSRYSQFVDTTPPDEKVTLLSKILEKKLSLDKGLRVLRHPGERQSKQENSGF